MILKKIRIEDSILTRLRSRIETDHAELNTRIFRRDPRKLEVNKLLQLTKNLSKMEVRNLQLNTARYEMNVADREGSGS